MSVIWEQTTVRKGCEGLQEVQCKVSILQTYLEIIITKISLHICGLHFWRTLVWCTYKAVCVPCYAFLHQCNAKSHSTRTSKCPFFLKSLMEFSTHRLRLKLFWEFYGKRVAWFHGYSQLSLVNFIKIGQNQGHFDPLRRPWWMCTSAWEQEIPKCSTVCMHVRYETLEIT